MIKKEYSSYNIPERELICTNCLTPELFWKNGHASTPASCECGCEKTILFKNLNNADKLKVISIYHYKELLRLKKETAKDKLYCVGFMFSKSNNKVALILKNRPKWQAGNYNGIGGKIEKNETPIQAMVREFNEETGVKTKESEWTNAINIYCSNNSFIYFFFSFGDLNKLKTTTDEKIEIFEINNLPINMIENLKWIIPLLIDRTADFSIPIEHYEISTI